MQLPGGVLIMFTTHGKSALLTRGKSLAQPLGDSILFQKDRFVHGRETERWVKSAIPSFRFGSGLPPTTVRSGLAVRLGTGGAGIVIALQGPKRSVLTHRLRSQKQLRF